MTETPNPHIVDADTLTDELHPIRRCVLALGANLGNRLESLQGAVDSLADTPGVEVTAVSPVYETDPVDAVSGSPAFLNAIVLADSTLAASALLERSLAVEAAFGRQRGAERGSPRTLDVDLILVGRRRSQNAVLTLPHPSAAARAFVLAPWHDVDPDAVLLDIGPVVDLLVKVGTAGVRRRDDFSLHVP